MQLPFSFIQHFVEATDEEKIANIGYNVTLPTCTQYDDITDGLKICPQCSLSSYNNDSALFKCLDMSVLCSATQAMSVCRYGGANAPEGNSVGSS